VPVDETLFKRVEGGPQELEGLLIDPGDTLAFHENEAGEVHVGFIALQNTAFERLGWIEGPEVQFASAPVRPMRLPWLTTNRFDPKGNVVITVEHNRAEQT
jgi:hypothetical protein